ncbi:Ribonuclease H [Phaffia rhodozyma]|uniref:ribonuclease H n=1 Tax=Phaffia rhodozyma TaxID=264483 RepID=A0A0F7SPW1_PHARH|nr:Ribonuclease H [Phaffia rhodozyma]
MSGSSVLRPWCHPLGGVGRALCVKPRLFRSYVVKSHNGKTKKSKSTSSKSEPSPSPLPRIQPPSITSLLSPAYTVVSPDETNPNPVGSFLNPIKVRTNFALAKERKIKAGAAALAAALVEGAGSLDQIEEDESGRLRKLDGTLVVYTDGSAKGSGLRLADAGWGVVWSHTNQQLNRCGYMPGLYQTSNRAELNAILEAIRSIPDHHSPVEIRTDSSYCVNIFTKFLATWRKRSFAGSYANLDLIFEIEDLLAKRRAKDPRKAPQSKAEKAAGGSLKGNEIRFVHLRGHKGELGNTMADKLADEGSSIPFPLPPMEYFGQREFSKLRPEWRGLNHKYRIPGPASIRLEGERDN